MTLFNELNFLLQSFSKRLRYKLSLTSRDRHIRCILLFFCIAFSTDSFSQPITIASPISIPPYVFSDSDTGIQLDIVRESLTIAGHSLKVMYASNNRGLNFLKAKVADGMINVPAGVPDLYYSASTIEYQNGVLALKSRKLVLSDVSDLQTLRIVGFQNASNYFGSEFKQLTQSNKNYDEVVNQLAQLNMLFKRRCDVVVMDHRIFNFHLNNNKTESGFDQETVFYNILPPSPRYVAFHNKALRDSFDKGLKELKASGRHQAIINSYLR